MQTTIENDFLSTVRELTNNNFTTNNLNAFELDFNTVLDSIRTNSSNGFFEVKISYLKMSSSKYMPIDKFIKKLVSMDELAYFKINYDKYDKYGRQDIDIHWSVMSVNESGSANLSDNFVIKYLNKLSNTLSNKEKKIHFMKLSTKLQMNRSKKF